MATTGTTGILTPAQESQLAVWLDDLVKLKGFWELIDGYIFKILITLLDDKSLDKLKVDLKAQLATDILVGLVQIPGVDSTVEGLIFGAAIQLAVAAIISKLQVKTGKVFTLKVAAAKKAAAKAKKANRF